MAAPDDGSIVNEMAPDNEHIANKGESDTKEAEVPSDNDPIVDKEVSNTSAAE